jgi:hypothetical protein
MQPIVLSTSYLAPVQYYAHILNASDITIEQHCHYMRQTYRNRCVIMSANEILPLTVPVVKPSDPKTKTRDIRLSYDTPWQKLHWKSITSAYQSTPYFEYYEDDFKPFYINKFEFLLDFNCQLHQLICETLNISDTYTLSSEYISPSSTILDFRDTIHPKKSYLETDSSFLPQPYRQVFGDRHGFVPNLSIIDLIFNKGPESYGVLKASLKP